MAEVVARRLLLAMPMLLGMSVVVFLILHLVPGDPALAVLHPRAPINVPGERFHPRRSSRNVPMRAVLTMDDVGRWIGRGGGHPDPGE